MCEVNGVIKRALKMAGQQEVYEQLLKEKEIHSKAKYGAINKIGNVKLIEQLNGCNSNNGVNAIYEWRTMLNKSQPLVRYKNKLSSNKTNVNSNNKNDNEIGKIKLPCVLIDVPVCKFNKCFTKEKRGVSVDSNVMKMKSIHSPKENNEMFYFSKEISDYYADDLNTYIKRTPQLQALKRCYSNKLMKMVKYVKKQNEMNDYMIYDCNSKVNMLKKKGVNISSKDMHIALKRNNAQPLIKGIYSQMKNEKINNKG